MINKLRRRLILIYTCSTGLIFTVVLVLVLAITNQQLLLNKKEIFQNNYNTVNQKLMMNNEISHLWLAEMEMKNNLIIHIEDSGRPLLYRGAWQPVTSRERLVEKVKQLARKDNIYTDIRPISLSENQSGIYQLYGDKNDRYFGEVFIIPMQKGYRSIVLLQYLSASFTETIKQKLLIILLYLSGLLELYLVSRWIVGKSLAPVEESRRRQTEFIASASHELKSPLAVIRANASALMVEPERAEHFTKGIDNECLRLSALIEDLLLLASADAKNWSVKKEMMDMDTLIIETYDAFQPLCKKNNKELRLVLQEELLPGVEGDALRIKQILSVLIDNAVSYSTDNDTIILRAYAKKNTLQLEVEDHGYGIDQKMRQEVFERFYKGDRSRKDKNHFGLGLSIAKELTELHGGRISIKDTEGGGVTFIISLPIYKAKTP